MRLLTIFCSLLVSMGAPLRAQPAKITTHSHLAPGAQLTVVHFGAPW